MSRFLFFLIVLISFSASASAQEVNIIPFLKQIESGEIDAARNSLGQLLRNNPNDPSVLFLDAVLTKNGVEALRKYISIYEKFPNAKYADASLYRMFSYYYALGYYKKAENYLEKLKFEYPSSPYIKAADRNIPEQVGVFYEETQEATNSSGDAEVVKLPAESPKDETAKFTVQAGAFLNKDNAESLKKKLEADGYDVALAVKNIGGSLLNVITVGKFVQGEDSKELIAYLSDKYKLQGRVVSLD